MGVGVAGDGLDLLRHRAGREFRQVESSDGLTRADGRAAQAFKRTVASACV